VKMVHELPIYDFKSGPLCIKLINMCKQYFQNMYITFEHVFLYRLEQHIIQSPRVEASMKAVDRKNYCPHSPYYDSPQSIG